jgi:hypothetical protein
LNLKAKFETGSRVKTGRFQATGPLDSTCTAPTEADARGEQKPLLVHQPPARFGVETKRQAHRGDGQTLTARRRRRRLRRLLQIRFLCVVGVGTGEETRGYPV